MKEPRESPLLGTVSVVRCYIIKRRGQSFPATDCRSALDSPTPRQVRGLSSADLRDAFSDITANHFFIGVKKGKKRIRRGNSWEREFLT